MLDCTTECSCKFSRFLDSAGSTVTLWVTFETMFRYLDLKPCITIHLKITLVTLSTFTRHLPAADTPAPLCTLHFTIYCTTDNKQADSLL